MVEEKKESPSEDWVAVAAASQEAEASFLVGFLENHGIPTKIVDKSFTLTPTASDEDLSEVEVAVPAARVDEARAALAQRDTSFASDSGGTEALMTDEGPAEIDPEPEGEKS
jgi:hypothetical protein